MNPVEFVDGASRRPGFQAELGENRFCFGEVGSIDRYLATPLSSNLRRASGLDFGKGNMRRIASKHSRAGAAK